MTSTFRWYIAGLLALFGAYVALEYYRPKPIDWRPTLSNKDKIPYGTFVLYDQLPRLLGTDSVEVTRLPIYNQLTGLDLAVTDAMADARTVTTEPDTVSEQAADVNGQGFIVWGGEVQLVAGWHKVGGVATPGAAPPAEASETRPARSRRPSGDGTPRPKAGPGTGSTRRRGSA